MMWNNCSTEHEIRRIKRRNLRRIANLIAIYGRKTYRQAKREISLKESASIFDLDYDTLGRLALVMKEFGKQYDTRRKNQRIEAMLRTSRFQD